MKFSLLRHINYLSHRFLTYYLPIFLFTVMNVVLTLPKTTFASAFQLWEQDGASEGNYHAGYAAWANDASTAFYNPAGMILIPNQQIVIAGVGVMTDFKFVGNVTVNTINAGRDLIPVTAQGGNFSFIPALHYVAPLSDRASFGFSIDVPFGLKTNYGSSTALKYAATLSSANVIDISPSIGLKVTDQWSIGFGPDIQRMFAEFDLIATDGGDSNTPSTNKLNDAAYGYHAGVLYQLTPHSRAGLSYHSQVVHHLSGSSKFVGPLANDLNHEPIISNRATSNITLPPYTALSFYHLANAKLAIMGSVIYTQWSTIRRLLLNDFAGIDTTFMPSTNIEVIVPEHYRNTWNFSLGADFFATKEITLRGGIGYDQTPVQDDYRNVQLPDNNRYVIALGGHYQATKSIGIDVGWTHFFVQSAHLNPPPEVVGLQVVTTNGNASGGGDVFSAQIVWDL